MTIGLKDIQEALESSEYISLAKLTGKRIKDIKGYLKMDGHDRARFEVYFVQFEDDSIAGVMGEGREDSAYLYHNDEQPNLDAKTLRQLYDEKWEEERL